MSAQFSADGKTLFFKYAPQDEEIYHLPRLTRVSWPGGGDATLVARDFDREPAVFAITPDSHTVYLLAPDGAKESLLPSPGRRRQTNRRDRARGRWLHRAGDSTESRQARAACQLR